MIVEQLKSVKIDGHNRTCDYINQNLQDKDILTITGSNDFYTIFYYDIVFEDSTSTQENLNDKD